MSQIERPPGRDRSSMFVGVLGVVLALALFVLVPVEGALWVTSLHILAVIAWMAGLLYLPRLFVYHVEAPVGTPQSETFKIMERRLLKAIVNPAMMITWIAGVWLAWTVFGFSGGWLHAKIALVVLMTGVHGYLSASMKRLARDERTRTARHWRIVNEIPTVLLILIVVLVVVKPF